MHLELEGEAVGGGGHFFPNFANGVQHFIFCSFLSESRKLAFEKYQAEGIFKHTRFGVLWEGFFQIKALDPFNDRFRC